MKYIVYIVRCADDTLYAGITTDLSRRLLEHNDVSKSGKGAKYTRARQPVALVYSAILSNRSQATREEMRIKKLSRTAKEELVQKHAQKGK